MKRTYQLPIRVGVIVGLLFMAATALATPTPAQDLVASFARLKTFSADFRQNTMSSDGVEVTVSTGTFVFERPQQLFWHTKAPDDIRIIGDGNTLWHYDVALGQVVRQPLKEVLEQTPAALLAGDNQELQKRFKIKNAERFACSVSDKCFELEPKASQNSFVKMWIGFQKGELAEVKLRDQLNQTSVIIFQKRTTNQKVDPALFVFKAPPNVEVLTND